MKSKAAQKATRKYEKENYWQINLKMNKRRESMIRYAAQQTSTSVNGFINHAIDFFLKNEMHYDVENCLDESGEKISFEKSAASEPVENPSDRK